MFLRSTLYDDIASPLIVTVAWSSRGLGATFSNARGSTLSFWNSILAPDNSWSQHSFAMMCKRLSKEIQYVSVGKINIKR